MSPSLVVYAEMRKKLQIRNQDPPEKIEERASLAYKEMQMMRSYNYSIVNQTGEGAIVNGKDAWCDPLAEEPKSVLEEFLRIIQE